VCQLLAEEESKNSELKTTTSDYSKSPKRELNCNLDCFIPEENNLPDPKILYVSNDIFFPSLSFEAVY